MKLTFIGGGGIRTPLAVAAALRRASRIGLEELCLMDTDTERLHIFGTLSRRVADAIDTSTRITLSTDAHEALTAARYVITSFRIGGDEGRVLDERIALRHGVLGQETTGAGGFAMAMRSIPAILDYAELLEQLSPGAWIINFTNPAGLVTQALRDRGFNRTIGICDSADGAQNAIAAWLHIDPRRLTAEVFGLNHLSWARRVWLDGEDVLAPLLREPDFRNSTLQRLFDPQLITAFNMWLNEYLYYYYYSDCALAEMSAHEKTRGEDVLAWNLGLLEQLRAIDVEANPSAAEQAYSAYMHQRIASYMQHSETNEPITGITDVEADEGYAGVALRVIEGLENGRPIYTALNVPNEGAITCMQPDDVVEVSCMVNGDGVHPQSIGDIPEPQELLMRTVKLYEKLAVQAILNRSQALAAQALMLHPLVLSYGRAEKLVDEYLMAHAAHVGVWQ
jgi:6-phospho-beta-glucosidase